MYNTSLTYSIIITFYHHIKRLIDFDIGEHFYPNPLFDNDWLYKLS